jgi:hypothetical protein
MPSPPPPCADETLAWVEGAAGHLCHPPCGNGVLSLAFREDGKNLSVTTEAEWSTPAERAPDRYPFWDNPLKLKVVPGWGKFKRKLKGRNENQIPGDYMICRNAAEWSWMNMIPISIPDLKMAPGTFSRFHTHGSTTLMCSEAVPG